MMFAIVILSGCGAYQPTKNVWKGTKSLWYTYVSPPASVDYEDRGKLPDEEAILAKNMKGVDEQLSRLERVMQNADKPPTQPWLDNLFENFSWLDGFAGVKYDGTILGQQPAESLKDLDFIPLLYEDKKQNSRSLRADVQPSPLGPEILVAAPLYDGVDFLGIVVAYFEMRSLMRYSANPQDMVILSPSALLWPGKYDFAATPLASVNWGDVVQKSVAGTCTNNNGSFFYMVRYLANQPLIFAIAQKGDFPEGNGDLSQGLQFFPAGREKLPPPPMPERKPKSAGSIEAFGQSGEEPAERMTQEGGLTEPESQGAESAPVQSQDRPDPNEIQPGSRDSMLLKRGSGRHGRQIEEKNIEGDNVEVERVQRPRVRRPAIPPEALELEPEPVEEGTPQIERPSPFGPKETEQEMPAFQPPSPFGPADGSGPAPARTDAEPLADGEVPGDSPSSQSETKANSADAPVAPAAPENKEAGPEDPPALPGGRPSPFGPGN